MATPRKSAKRKMTAAEKYAELKRQTEAAGMVVRELNGSLLVTRKTTKK